MKQNSSIVIIGSGGHAKMVYDMAQQLMISIRGIVSPSPALNGVLSNLDWLGDDETYLKNQHSSDLLVNAIGSIGTTIQRQLIFERYQRQGCEFTSLCHPNSYISNIEVYFREGFQILPFAIVNTHTTLGKNVLINTRAVVEHDCHIGDHSHVASGAVICGGCHVGDGVHIGAGAVINQGLTIGNGAVIASGAVVIEDVSPNCLMAGVPAQRKRAHVV